MKFLILLLSILIFSGNLSYAQHEGHQKVAKEAKSSKQKDIYYCPMHPTYISDKPGDCPICNMKLVKKEEAAQEQVQKPGGVYISPEKQQLIGVKVDKATSRPFLKSIRTVGRVAFDPGLYEAQAEYIEALKTRDKIKASGEEKAVERINSLVEAARFKLELAGLSKEQVEGLGMERENDSSLLISRSGSPVSWIYATIYEYELEYIKIGQEVSIKTVAYPDKEFKGIVMAIDPVFDAMTRSVRARIKTENKDALLKPNMYVDIEISSDLGTKLAVPREAVMDTGLRKIVFISLPEGRFESRQVKTGASNDNYVEITDGLQEGESVVTSGNFLIDSESKLKSALEGTHQHSQ